MAVNFPRLRSYRRRDRSEEDRYMPARTGQQYIDGLRDQEREVWLGGERVRDVTMHKGLSGGVRAIAPLYDMRPDAKLRTVMPYNSPPTREPAAPPFAIPTPNAPPATRSTL